MYRFGTGKLSFRIFRMTTTTISNGHDVLANASQERLNSIPFTTADDAKDIIKRLYNMNVIDIKKFDSYEDLNFYIKTDNNSTRHGNEFVFKISNTQLSLDKKLFDAQSELLFRLKEAGISAPVPFRDVNGQHFSLQHLQNINDDVVVMEGNYMVRLLTYIPGERLVTVKNISLDLFYDVGKILAQIHNAWKGYEHPSLIREDFEWHLRSAVHTRAYAHLVKEQWQRDISEAVLNKFEAEVLPVYDNLTRGIIHGDLNELNILVTPSNVPTSQQRYMLSGVIDFGDTTVSPYIFDVSISLAYMMLTDIEESSIPSICKWFLSGYGSVSKIPDFEVNMVVTMMCARLVQSLLMGLYYHSMDPTNTYILCSQKRGWQALKNVWKLSIDDIKTVACPK
ncbi:hydroxylysine kinase-like [Antedon mediterranea]|uniref:hydroxylysine kinase-like n=1 Tax=Antedon mediterranea TaxID=105859 RepID=UPI003AF745D6